MAGHRENDFLGRAKEVPPVQVSELVEEPSGFHKGPSRSPEANLTVSELLSVQDFRREADGHGELLWNRQRDGPRGADCSRASRENETVCARGGFE